MRTHLYLAAAFSLALTVAAAAHAQLTSPDTLIAPAPRNPADRSAHKSATDDLQWLWQYSQPAPSGNKPALLLDPRFAALLQANLKTPQAFWSTPGSPLAEAASAFLSGPGAVTSTDNRHLTVTGCVPDPEDHQCTQHGLLFADLGERTPLLVFAALRWNEQSKTPGEPNAPYTLWLFPSRDLDAHLLPVALKSSLSAFTGGGGCTSPTITSAIVVDPTGVPHIVGLLETGVHPSLCTSNPGSSVPGTGQPAPNPSGPTS